MDGNLQETLTQSYLRRRSNYRLGSQKMPDIIMFLVDSALYSICSSAPGMQNPVTSLMLYAQAYSYFPSALASNIRLVTESDLKSPRSLIIAPWVFSGVRRGFRCPLAVHLSLGIPCFQVPHRWLFSERSPSNLTQLNLSCILCHDRLSATQVQITTNPSGSVSPGITSICRAETNV